MIPHGVEVFVGLDPIDLRWSFERLTGLVTERLGREVRGGALFVFFGRRHDALKIFFFDGSGLCIFYKRLDAARSGCESPAQCVCLRGPRGSGMLDDPPRASM